MKLKFLVASICVLIIGVLVGEGHQNIRPAIDKVRENLTARSFGEVSHSKNLSATEIEKKLVSDSSASKDEIQSRLKEIDLFIKNSNMIERLNDRNLDPSTREEFFTTIQLKQSLLNRYVEMEIEASRELLAGSPR